MCQILRKIVNIAWKKTFFFLQEKYLSIVKCDEHHKPTMQETSMKMKNHEKDENAIRYKLNKRSELSFSLTTLCLSICFSIYAHDACFNGTSIFQTRVMNVTTTTTVRSFFFAYSIFFFFFFYFLPLFFLTRGFSGRIRQCAQFVSRFE